MLEFRLALQNLWRHKRRTLMTALVVAMGVLVYSAMDSLLAGTEEDSYRSLVAYEVGEVALYRPGYWAKRDELPLDKAIPEAAALVRRLEKVDGVRGVAPRLKFSASVNNGIEEMPVTAIGIDPEADARVLQLKGAVKEGAYLEAGSPGAILGRDLAKVMDLKVGDYFTLVLRTQSQSFEAVEFEVTGIAAANAPSVNDGTVYVPLDVAQAAVNLPNSATELLVKGSRGYKDLGTLPDEIRQALGPEAPRFEVVTWERAAEDYLSHVESDRVTTSILLGIIGLIAALGVVNNILLAGMERRREIGTLKALGMTETQITRLFMLEGMGIGLVGGVLGVILSTVTVYFLAERGMDYSAFNDYNLGMAIEGVFRGAWNWGSIFGAWLFGTVFSYLVSWWPAHHAARLDPASALHA